jgi:cytochrome P450
MSRCAGATPLFDLLSPKFRDDPYPEYRRLREEAPILPLDTGIWAVAGYEECHSILRDPAWSADVRNQRLEALELGFRGRSTPVAALLDQLMVFRDPPDHTRLRRLVQKAFSPRRVSSLAGHISEVVDDLLDDVVPRGEMEVISEFASCLPVIVIADLLGIPADDRPRFRVWAEDLAPMFEPLFDEHTMVRAGRAGVAFGDYFRALIAERRQRPADDLLSALVQAEDEGDQLSETELIINCALLLIAGHETTTNLIANGLLALSNDPEQLARMRGSRALVPAAVEEMLRYDSPVQMTLRTAVEEREIAGRSVSPGDSVLLLLGSANRDPSRFHAPDRLDITRADNQHLAFGGGPHYCLGNALARLEAACAFGSLVRRMSDFELATEGSLAYRDTIALRGPEALPIRFSAVV